MLLKIKSVIALDFFNFKNVNILDIFQNTLNYKQKLKWHCLETKVNQQHLREKLKRQVLRQSFARPRVGL